MTDFISDCLYPGWLLALDFLWVRLSGKIILVRINVSKTRREDQGREDIHLDSKENTRDNMDNMILLTSDEKCFR